MNDFNSPYDQYQAKGYSAKHTFLTVFGGTIGVGLVGIMFYIVVKFLTALDHETLRTMAIWFFTILLSLIGIGGSLAIVVIFRFVQKPGVQMPGVLGKLEKKWEEIR